MRGSRKGKINWAGVNWAKTNEQLAEKLGVSVALVQKRRTEFVCGDPDTDKGALPTSWLRK